MTAPKFLRRTLTSGVLAMLALFVAHDPEAAQETSARPKPHAAGSPADPQPAGSPAALIELHGCWTGDAPPDMAEKIPGHVVVTRPTSAHAEYLGDRMVGRALDHVFNHKNRGLIVHAFCR